MIVTDKFKSFSLFTEEELDESLIRDVENMSEAERAVFFELLHDPQFEGDLNALELDREVVPVEQWIEDDYFMGTLGKTIYKPWKDDLIELFESSQYDTAVIVGGIGCVGGETLVQLADGSLERIDSIGHGASRHVIAYDHPALAIGVHSGQKDIMSLEMGSGFKIRATPEHKWMTQVGWVQTKDLKPELHRIKTARRIKIIPTRTDITVKEAEWAGVFLSAGKLHRTSVSGIAKYIFIKTDQSRIDIFKRLCQNLSIPFECPGFGYIHILESDVRSILKKLDIDDPLRRDRIPRTILQSSNEILAGFIRGALISCSISGMTADSNTAINFPVQKIEFQSQLMLALKRFGIRTRLYESQTSNGYLSWQISLKGKTNFLLFHKQIGFIGPEQQNRLNVIIDILQSKLEKSHADLLPVNYGQALSWTKKYNVSIGKTKYAKWCAKNNSHLRVAHNDIMQFFRMWPHMESHAHEIFYDENVYWEEIRAVKAIDGKIETYDLIVPDDNCYLAHGMLSHNSGKSTFSHLAVLRMLYEASCLKNPAVSYGLSPNSVIGFCSLAKSKETARRVVFEQLASKIQESPYFKYEFPPIKDLKDEIVFPKGLAIICGSSTDTSIIGMNIFGGIIDEVNFWGKVKKTNLAYGKNWGTESKSGRLFDSVRRRMKSRYVKKGKLPGIIMLVSSKTTKDSFTEQFIRKEQALGNKATFVRDRSILEMKRDSFGSRTFRVLVGTVDYASRILAEGEDISHLKDAMAIEIPEDFRIDFENNLEESLRDIAGVSTIAISNFIAKVDKINEIVDHGRVHPFTCPLMDDPTTWDSRKPYRINWDLLCNRKPNGDWIPKLNPEAPRHVHFDPGFTNDAFGLCIGHVAGMIPLENDGQITEYRPHFVIDFILKIQGTKEDDVLNHKVRELVYEFSDHGFHFAEFSMDTYQCFTGDTKVKLLDGRSLSMIELCHEFGRDKEFWVYSFDGERIVPGKARNARQTGRRQTVIVELDNGEKVRCTEDHPWMMRDGTYKSAASLVTGDSLMPLYSRISKKDSAAGMNGYEEIYQPFQNKWELTHRMVGRGIWKNIKGKNHKVVSITKGNIEDVYDIEVDVFHNFALQAGVFVHNSREMIQALEQQGFKAGIYSVDTGNSTRGENVINTAVGRVPKAKQAYWYLRSVIYENRVKCYDYPILLGELRRLEDGPEKVDHPEGESKDLADALCGCVWTLFRAKHGGEFLAPSRGITVAASGDEETVRDYQESITDRTSNTVQPTLHVDDIKKTKVYEKKKPQTIGPKYQKVAANGAVQDLTWNGDVEDYLQRG